MRSFLVRFLTVFTFVVCLATTARAQEPVLQKLDYASLHADPGFVTYRSAVADDGKSTFVMTMTCRVGYYPAWITTRYQGKMTDRHLCLPINSELVEVVDRCDDRKRECRLSYRLMVADFPVSLDHYAVISVQRLSGGKPMCQPLYPLDVGETLDPRKVDCGIRHNGRLVMYQGAIKPLLRKNS